MSKKSVSIQVARPGTNGARIGVHPDEGDIAFRAHEIFAERGAGPGQELDDWLQAERELMASFADTQRDQISKPVVNPTNIR